MKKLVEETSDLHTPCSPIESLESSQISEIQVSLSFKIEARAFALG